AFVAQNEGLKILETEYAIEDYAIAVKKENTELLDKINAALEKLTADGTIDKIIANYISAE
ncbi:MAG: transporter substrate-binding domain-containing protein, partial [Clostridia bacterium]|nr:transporter substrate-binding domain-containing protein [Clostridia bacterium]